MNYAQFGQTIKQKYPQYQNVSDDELGRKMVEKYPQYKSRITEDNLLQRFARGVSKVAPVAGGILGGIGGAVVGAPAGGVGAIPGSAIGTAAGTGAGLALGEGLETLTDIQDEPVKERAREAVVKPVGAGVLDLATAGLLKGGGALLGKFTKPIAEKLPGKIMSQVFKEPLKETRAALRAGVGEVGETLGEQALKEGEKGSADSIFIKSINMIEGLENQLQQTISSAKNKVKLSAIRKAVDPIIKQYKVAGNNTVADAIESRLASIEANSGKELTAKVANEIKRTLYDEARNGYGKLASENVEGIKAIARGFKEQIEKVGGEEIEAINKQLSYHGRIADSMVDRIARVGRNELLSLKNAILVGGALPAAPATGGLSFLAPLAGITAGTTQGMTGLAQALKKSPAVGKAIYKGTDVLRRIIDNLLVNQQ